MELWEEDVRWAHSLWSRLRASREEKQRQRESAKAAKIVELDEEGSCNAVTPVVDGDSDSQERQQGEGGGPVVEYVQKKPPREGQAMPANYVRLRDGLIH